MVQEDARKILKQAGVKERMVALDLSTLEDGFYQLIKEFISNLQGEDKQQMESIFNSIIMSRKSKITRLAESVNEEPEIRKKLTAEEKEYFDSIVSATKQFKEKVMT